MTNLDLIICERTNRWAPALRVAISRSPLSVSTTPDGLVALATSFPCAIHEVRTLEELTAKKNEVSCRLRLNEPPPPTFLALIETTPQNLAEVLSWIVFHDLRGTGRTVALLDRSFGDPANVTDALHEAGAAEIATSPRQLGPVLRLAACLSARFHPPSNGPQPGQSFSAWAHSLLPWQDAQRRLG